MNKLTISLLVLLLVSFDTYSQRNTLINTEKVLLKGGQEISIIHPGANELLSTNVIGSCGSVNTGTDPLYEQIFSEYFYKIFPDIVKSETKNKIKKGFTITPLSVGTYPFKEGYDKIANTEVCRNGSIEVEKSTIEEVDIGTFTIKVVEFEKIFTNNIIAVKDGEKISLNSLYTFSDDTEKNRLNFSDNIPNGIFDPISEGQTRVSISAEFDNGPKSIEFIIEVLDFKPTQGVTIELCDQGNDLIDLSTFHTLANHEGISINYMGIGVVNEKFLDPNRLISDNNTIEIVASGFQNGTKKLNIDFIKRDITANAGANQAVCKGNILNLVGGSPAGGTWSSPSFPIKNGNEIMTSPLDAGTYDVTYTITSGACQGSKTKQIEIFPAPTIDIGEDISVCNSESTYELGSGTPVGGEWSTDDPNLNISNGVINLQLLDIPEVGFADYNIYYSYTNNNNCTSEAKKKLRVFAAPAAPVLTASSLCGGGQVTIEIANFNPTFIYEWYKEDQIVIGANGQSLTTGVLNDQTNYKVIARSPFLNTCSDVGEIDIKVVTPPSKPIVQTDIRCGAGEVILRAGGVAGATYRWYNTNDILLGEGDEFKIEIVQTTLFYVSAVIDGCEGEKTEVTATSLFQPPAPLVTGTNRCGQGAVSVTASGAASGGEYLWYSSMDAQTPILSGIDTYVENELMASKKVFVAVRMQDTGCESIRKEVELQVLPIPARPEVQDTYFCEGLSGLSLEIDNPVGSYTYEWYSQIPATTASLLATGTRFFTGQLTGSTSYYVQAVSTGACRSEAKEVKTIFVEDAPMDIGGDTIVCAYGEKIALDNDLPEAFQGQGIFTGSGVFGRIFNQSTVGNGAYSISYQANLGGCPITGSRTIQVQSGVGSTTLSISESSFLICPEEIPYDLRQLTLEYPNGTFSGNGVNGNSFSAPQGSYGLIYTLDTAGCSYGSSFNITVLENNEQTPLILSDKEVYCMGDIAVLEARGNGGGTYHWYSDNNLENKVNSGNKYNALVEQPSIFVISEDVNGCTSKATSYSIPTLSLPTVINNSSDTIGVGGFVQFSIDPINPSIASQLTLSWNFGNGEFSTQLAPAVFYHSSGQFEVSLEVRNGNCTDTLYTGVFVKNDSINDLVTSVQGTEETRPFLYPQPISDRLYIQVPNGNWQCNIYDVHGRTVYQNLMRSSWEISTSKWMGGLYLLILKSEERTFNFKVLKQ